MLVLRAEHFWTGSLALNRDLYHLQLRSHGGRPKAVPPFKASHRHEIWSVDIRYLDMHRLENVEMVYCISILENFSRAVLASAISLRQDTEAFFAVFYAAVRKYGVPEVLISDSGSVFISHDTRQVCEQLGIAKKEIKKGRPWQNYIETMLYVIWNSPSCYKSSNRITLLKHLREEAKGERDVFSTTPDAIEWFRYPFVATNDLAKTWEDLLAAHEKWMLDYNHQKHLLHDKREDGCHSPAAVLGWVKGMQPESDLVSRVFSALCETRTLTKAGYARFRNFLLYGEQGLAGKNSLVNIFQDSLTLEYRDIPLSRYSVEWQPDDRHFLRVGNPRLYDHPYQSQEQVLWEPGEVEWHVILRADPPVRRRKHRGRVFVMQPPLFAEEARQGID